MHYLLENWKTEFVLPEIWWGWMSFPRIRVLIFCYFVWLFTLYCFGGTYVHIVTPSPYSHDVVVISFDEAIMYIMNGNTEGEVIHLLLVPSRWGDRNSFHLKQLKASENSSFVLNTYALLSLSLFPSHHFHSRFH